MKNDKKLQIQVVGMVWYNRENYERVRSMREDGNNLHSAYEKGLKAADIGCKTMESSLKIFYLS